ncbi:mscS Mechanosensitive ion channel domain protein [Burkholderia cepacia]|nr:mscS Mechanosensitive ion channel domain protein [Burkholderia cepacia]
MAAKRIDPAVETGSRAVPSPPMDCAGCVRARKCSFFTKTWNG